MTKHPNLPVEDLVKAHKDFIVAIGSEASIDDVVAEHSREVNSRIVRGARSSSRKGLFQEWAAALQFPWYFGANWDAFEECLLDLSWLNRDRLTVFATKVDQILIDEAREEFETLLTVLRDACAGETRVSLAVVFHAESAEAAIERLGTEVQLRTI